MNRNGDEEWGALRTRLIRIAIARRIPDAEEVVQEVLYRTIRLYGPEAPSNGVHHFVYWVRAVRNVVAARQRHIASTGGERVLLEEVRSLAAPPTDFEAQEVVREWLEKARRVLTTRQWMVLCLMANGWRQKLPGRRGSSRGGGQYVAIADRLGMSEVAVRVHVCKMRRRLRAAGLGS